MKQVLLVALSFTLMATQCTQCICDQVIEKESVAAGWCVLRVEDCQGNVTDYPVDELEYESYNVGDCYP
jgi:hypothetical protein